MPKLAQNKLPAYRRHKRSGLAVVTLNGKDVYLGRWKSPESREAYARVTGEWSATGRQAVRDSAPLTVVEVLAAFWRHAKVYYRQSDGTTAKELEVYKLAVGPLKDLYGRSPAIAFGPLALKAVREGMIARGWTRKSVNRHCTRVRSVFKWAAENELVPAEIHTAISKVAGLRKGRSPAPEGEPVQPVDDALVNAVLPFLSSQVRAIVTVQRLTGMRPGEVCGMRPCEIDRLGETWVYQPHKHKTDHHDHDRVVPIGPLARAIVEPLVKPDPQAYLFDPRDAVAERQRRRAAARVTPASCGNRPGTNRKLKPKRSPGVKYTTVTYRRAVERACWKAFPLPPELAARRVPGVKGTRWEREGEHRKRLGKRWADVLAWRAAHYFHPHQIRHTTGTELRARFGVEAAQVILGHRQIKVTELYARKNVDEAKRIMAEVG